VRVKSFASLYELKIRPFLSGPPLGLLEPNLHYEQFPALAPLPSHWPTIAFCARNLTCSTPTNGTKPPKYSAVSCRPLCFAHFHICEVCHLSAVGRYKLNGCFKCQHPLETLVESNSHIISQRLLEIHIFAEDTLKCLDDHPTHLSWHLVQKGQISPSPNLAKFGHM
jgi:hypothetical protein